MGFFSRKKDSSKDISIPTPPPAAPAPPSFPGSDTAPKPELTDLAAPSDNNKELPELPAFDSQLANELPDFPDHVDGELPEAPDFSTAMGQSTPAETAPELPEMPEAPTETHEEDHIQTNAEVADVFSNPALTQQLGPLFVDIEEYKSVLKDIVLIKDEANQIQSYSHQIKALNQDLDSHYDVFRQQVITMNRKILLIERKLFADR